MQSDSSRPTHTLALQPTPSGLDCPNQSPCTTIWSSKAQDNVPASQVYNEAIQAAAAKGIRTVLSIGGCVTRHYYSFTTCMRINISRNPAASLSHNHHAIMFGAGTVESGDNTAMSRHLEHAEIIYTLPIRPVLT